MLIPLKIELPLTRWPIANFILIILTGLFYFLTVLNIIPAELSGNMVLRDFSISGLIGSLFLHGSILHLFINMLYLWLFGNIVCAITGNLLYPLLYLFTGIIAGSTHLLLSGEPAIGASGAVNGLLGIVLVLAPTAQIQCFYFFFLFFRIYVGTFQIKVYWLILIWFFLDLLNLLIGVAGVSHLAHIGGFLTGIATGFLILRTMDLNLYEQSLPEMIRDNRQRY